MSVVVEATSAGKVSAYAELTAMKECLERLREQHQRPYGNDLAWCLSEAQQAIERAIEATPESRYSDE